MRPGEAGVCLSRVWLARRPILWLDGTPTENLRTGQEERQVSLWLAGAAFCWHLSAKQAADLLRGHWNLENGVFYVRDVTMGEDRLPGRKIGYALSQIRNAALNLLRTLDTPYIPDARRHLAARKDLGLPLLC